MIIFNFLKWNAGCLPWDAIGKLFCRACVFYLAMSKQAFFSDRLTKKTQKSRCLKCKKYPKWIQARWLSRNLYNQLFTGYNLRCTLTKTPLIQFVQKSFTAQKKKKNRYGYGEILVHYQIVFLLFLFFFF